MANETCKFCEAPVVGPPTDFDHGCGTKTTFECGSRYYTNRRGAVDWVRCENCKDRELAELRNQLAAVTAERDDLQQRLDAAPVGYAIEWADRTWSVLKSSDNMNGTTRVRLVRDDQPQQETVK